MHSFPATHHITWLRRYSTLSFLLWRCCRAASRLVPAAALRIPALGQWAQQVPWVRLAHRECRDPRVRPDLRDPLALLALWVRQERQERLELLRRSTYKLDQRVHLPSLALLA